MLKKTITYTDFNGVERTEDFYFHLTEAEVSNMELDAEGGLANKIQKIVDSKDISKIKDYFQWLVLKSYGEKSDDGRRFMKSEEISKNFSYTQAYSDLWMELITETDAAIEFVKGIMPKAVVDRALQENPNLLEEVSKAEE